MGKKKTINYLTNEEIQGCKDGNEVCLEKMYNNCMQMKEALEVKFYYNIRNRELELDDILSNTHRAIAECIHSYDFTRGENCKFESFVYGKAFHYIARQIRDSRALKRGGKYKDQLSLDYEYDGYRYDNFYNFLEGDCSPHESLQNQEYNTMIDRVLEYFKNNLKPIEYQVMYYYYKEGMRQPQIAIQVNTSQATVSRILRRVTNRHKFKLIKIIEGEFGYDNAI